MNSKLKQLIPTIRVDKGRGHFSTPRGQPPNVIDVPINVNKRIYNWKER